MSFSKEEITEALEVLKELGSQRQAAKVLGYSRRSLQRRLSYYEKNKHLLDASEQEGMDHTKVNHYWIKTKTGSYHVSNDTNIDYNELRENFLEEAQIYAPQYNDNRVSYSGGSHLLVIDIADIHFGKLGLKEETGDDYNIQVAEKRMREGTTALINKAQGHGIGRIVFVLGNDVLHIDNPFRKTTSGTPQDTDGMWWSAFNAAKKAYISAIEELARVAPVHLVFNPSNHDYMSGFMLADSIASWFHNHPNVITVDASLSISHRKYIQYGINLLGFTHGDGAKDTDLPALMQYEARQAWGNTRYAYWHTHHLHTKNRKVIGKNKYNLEKDHIGITVINSGREIEPENNTFIEIIRSPSSADSWHDRNGYKGNAAIECFLYHDTDGQVARFTHYF